MHFFRSLRSKLVQRNPVRQGSSAAKAVCPMGFEDIPGPKSFPLVGTMYDYVPGIGNYNAERMHHSGLKKMQKYGNVVKEEILPGFTIAWLYDPTDVEYLFRSETRWPARYSHKIIEYYRMVQRPDRHNTAGLLPTNGETWGTLRSSYQKAFHRDTIMSLIPGTDDTIMDLVAAVDRPNLQEAARKDFMDILLVLNCELIGSNFFDVKWGAFDNVNNPESLTEQLKHAATYINSSIDKTDHGKLWKYIPTTLYSNVEKYLNLLETTAEESIARLRKEDRRDKYPCIAEMWMKDEKNNGQDIVTMCADMILAGIDTTAYTLGFIMYHLGTNERVQTKLYNELRSLDPEKNSPMTADLLSQAAYSRKIIKESLRLNPVAIGNGRFLTEDKCFSGFTVPEHTVIVTMNQIMSRLPQYYEKPNEFIPERYDIRGYFKKPRPFVTLPFGHGPRACIGRRLAEQIMQIFLFRMYRNYEIIWKGVPNLDCVTCNINSPDAPLKFDFIPRQS